jgi:AcrR family transcriptional regulator
MTPAETDTAILGLRERKKQQTRERIADAALKLFAERGYDETTLDEIADAADVSRRTIFAYYDSKEEILFCGESDYLARLKQMLDERPESATTVDAIRQFLSTIEPLDDAAVLRKELITRTPALQMKARAQHAEIEPMLAESIAKDLDADPHDIRTLLIAASITAAFMSVSERLNAAEAAGRPVSHEDAMAILDEVLEFLRGGLEALQPD